MPVTISSEAQKQLQNPRTEDAWLVLLKFEHPDFPADLLFSSDEVHTVSRGVLTANDETSNNYHGTLSTQNLLYRGILGESCLKFPGQTLSTPNVSIPLGVFNTLSDFTIEWIQIPERLDVAGGHQPTLIDVWNVGVSNEVRIQLDIASGQNKIKATIKDAEVEWATVNNLPELAEPFGEKTDKGPGHYYRFALTRDGTTGDVELFYTRTRSTTAVSLGVKSLPTGALSVDAAGYIGRAKSAAATTAWMGRIDDLRVWSDKRTALEVGDNAHAELVGTEPGFQAYWKFNEGNQYIAFPFGITLPSDEENAPPKAMLRISNVDRRIVQEIRGLASSPAVTIELVRAVDPHTVEVVYTGLELLNAKYDAQIISGDIAVRSFSREPYPASLITPSLFRGLY
jgi:hypothetical protein